MQNSTALGDQFQAASAHTAATLDSVLGPGRSRSASLTDLPDWFKTIVAALYQNQERGRLPVCAHLASPAPAVVFSEQPDRLRCGRCAFEDGAQRRCSQCDAPAGPTAARDVVRHESLLFSIHHCPSR
ncbi:MULTISPECIES: hypothetical protein [unclassified Streptomyces]|uniref:hypothetical protein n=1 Tax=unclassified Streptomyces TaxID=2593676 RepID=UPI00087EFB5E|nr:MULTISPECIES: hypothetical protein [unclassified Streptomyces]PBC80218.1 hypothetical protein BX261_0027 [Streptomyces sp. 2321.6]PBC87083.1 hypothetical protein BX261_7221 [Streptomyces sp. 2321.6]SDQ62110.1 hypothetical protein SAMN05216511_0029 [Streptomyces sp. KS_16]SEB66406.1 hypothetical protein SAMN05428940_0027 [Streptomyces sp. 2133.1]SEE18723.1 hypothetical protein SAMN05428940_7246 [Streptomyces sp. 2133.1]